MVVILYNIRSLFNVGAVFRTADAAGVEKVYLCGITPAPIDVFGRPRQQLTKVSLGAEKYVKWEKIKSTAQIIDKLKKDNYKIFAVEQNKMSVPYFNIKRSPNLRVERLALVLGNEIKGLPSSILKRADKILEIPMRGAMVRQAHHPRRLGRGKESLNVAVAFGIVVYHFLHSS